MLRPLDRIEDERLSRLLPLSGEWRKSEAENENDREPDPPHGQVGA